jgi:hypothetical protein
MDFVERIFGVSPDGGNGLLEVLILIVPLVVVILAVMVFRRPR